MRMIRPGGVCEAEAEFVILCTPAIYCGSVFLCVKICLSLYTGLTNILEVRRSKEEHKVR